MRRSAVAILLVFGWAVRRSPVAHAQGLGADAIVSEVLATRVGTPMSQWRTRVPTAQWRRYRDVIDRFLSPDPKDDGIWPSGMWCVVATDTTNRIERLAVFLAGGTGESLDCRLELTQSVIRLPEMETARLYERLVEQFSARLKGGSPVDLSFRDLPLPWGGETGRPPSVSRWSEGRQWPVPQGDLFVFYAREAVGIALRSRSAWSLSLHEDDSPFQLSGFLDGELATALQPRFPSVGEALSYEDGTGPQPALRRALIETLVARRESAKGRMHTVLTLAADRLARRLWFRDSKPLGTQPEGARLLQFGLRFQYDYHESRWQYDGALARRAIRDAPASALGELAFAERLQAGWLEGCAGGEYEAVIRHGVAWLRGHARSPWRVSVMTAVAQAYETEWSGWDGFTPDPAVNRRTIDAASERARREALAWYERLMREAPASLDAAYARGRVAQIRMNMDTGQRTFACVIP